MNLVWRFMEGKKGVIMLYPFRYTTAAFISLGILVYASIWNHAWIISTVLGFALGFLAGHGFNLLRRGIDVTDPQYSARRIDVYKHIADGVFIITLAVGFLILYRFWAEVPIYKLPFFIVGGVVLYAMTIDSLLYALVRRLGLMS